MDSLPRVSLSTVPLLPGTGAAGLEGVEDPGPPSAPVLCARVVPAQGAQLPPCRGLPGNTGHGLGRSRAV